MPCRDYYDDVRVVENPVNKEMKRRLDLATKLLCRALTKLESNRGDEVLSDLETDRWWIAHKEDDRKAEAALKAKLKAQREAKQKEVADLKQRIKKLEREL